jgi:hypothetical protein
VRRAHDAREGDLQDTWRVAQRLLREWHFVLLVGAQREDTTVIVHYSVRISGSAGAPRVAVTRGAFAFDLCPGG